MFLEIFSYRRSDPHQSSLTLSQTFGKTYVGSSRKWKTEKVNLIFCLLNGKFWSVSLGTFHRAKTLKMGRVCALIQASQFDDHCRTVIFKVRPHTYDCLYFTSLYDKWRNVFQKKTEILAVSWKNIERIFFKMPFTCTHVLFWKNNRFTYRNDYFLNICYYINGSFS